MEAIFNFKKSTIDKNLPKEAKMTIKEAILKSLEDLDKPSTSVEVHDLVIKKQYYIFEAERTPKATISALLGNFIRENDSRVKRIKHGRRYLYYLAKLENDLDLDESIASTSIKTKTYKERDLHILLSSYLKSKNIYSKTILHEESKNSKDDHQKWIHPDMVSVEYTNLKSKTNKAFMKILNKTDTFKLTSYEIKREINTDYELKKCYFQAVSNSSWANYGYLVAFEISDNLINEIQRLNQAFGIGVIELKSNPFQSKILFQSTHKELDFKTIDKLCKVNTKYDEFIEFIEKSLSAEDRFEGSVKKELYDFCDEYFENDTQIEAYCKDKNIPLDDDL